MFNAKALALAGMGLMTAGSASALQAVAPATVTIYGAPVEASGALVTVPATSLVTVDGCLADGPWCQVSYNGVTGWVPAGQIGVQQNNTVVMLSERPAGVTTKTVTYTKGSDTEQNSATAVGVGAGAAAGAAVGGPVGAVVGALIGGVTLHKAAEPTTETVTYVEKNPLPPVYLEGEVITGAVVPDAVTLVPVPDSQFAYLNINDTPVLVNPDNRQIVYVVN